MIRKVPIIGPSARVRDIIRAAGQVTDASAAGELEDALRVHTGLAHIYLTGSGIAAFYLILKALSQGSSRDEVVLPAYTAGSLVVAVRKAGLKCVLCDVSLKDYNADVDSMLGAVTEKTLAVVPVHMFGIGLSGIGALRERLPAGVIMVEDCCQAMGSRLAQSSLGRFGDVSFFSFNRGKNLPACGGGAIVTGNEDLSLSIADTVKRYMEPASKINIMTLLKTSAFSLAMNPWIFGCLYPLASLFRENAPARDFKVAGMEAFQKALALILIKRFDGPASKRYDNGIFLHKVLSGEKAFTLPQTAAADRVVFNRFPILFNEAGIVPLAIRKLWACGIESSRMYLRPLHHMFDLGYPATDFPNACGFAQRVLTLPVHPMVRRKDLERIVRVLKGICR